MSAFEREPGVWSVEKIDDDGGIEQAIFIGPGAERRCRKYASLSAENERLRKALKNAHDFGCMSFCWATNHEEHKEFEKQQAESWGDFCQQTSLAAHVGKGEKDGLE